MTSFTPALLLLASTASGLPEFTFREHSSSAIYDMSVLTKGAGCRDTEIGRRCVSETTVAGWRVDLSFIVVAQRLYALDLFGNHNAAPDVLAALRARYGKPCRSATETVKNRLGGAFSSATFTWCFRSGDLVFRERDYRMDTFSVIYTDRENAPKRPEMKPDF